MADFSRRADLQDSPEWMDGPCSYEDLRDCLRDLAVVNRLTGAYRPTLGWLETVVGLDSPPGPLRIVDVGCGYGDMLRRIEIWAARRGLAVELIGVDLNPDAVRAAREATPAESRIRFIAGNVYSCAQAQGADLVVSSLLTHHLSEAEIVHLLRWMESTARRGWFVSDLHRQAVPYHFFRAVAPVSGWHRFVHHDGPVSILRSFVPEDWRRMCAAAGLSAESVNIDEWRPARLCVGRAKSARLRSAARRS
jgi:SAM-dependent methyltransferase